MDDLELLWGLDSGSTLAREAQGRTGDETDYTKKRDDALDLSDVSGSEVESEDGGDDEDEEQRAVEALDDEALAAAWKHVLDRMSGLVKDEEHTVVSGHQDGETILKWTNIFHEREGVDGEEYYLEEDLQRGKEMAERRHRTLHGKEAGAGIELKEEESAWKKMFSTFEDVEENVEEEKDASEDDSSELKDYEEADARGQKAMDVADDDAEDVARMQIEFWDWEQSIVWDADQVKESKAPAAKAASVRRWIGEADTGRWLEDVIWDDDDPEELAKKRRSTRLVLDQSDADVAWLGRVKEKPAARSDSSQVGGSDASGRALFDEASDPWMQMSSDGWYRALPPRRAGARARLLDRTPVAHALPALTLATFKTFLDPGELASLHRPRLRVPAGHRVSVRAPAASAPALDRARFRTGVAGLSKVRGAAGMQSKAELSAVDGPLLQVEYLEQYPPLLNEVGMGLLLQDFYRQQSEVDVPPEPQWGETALLHPADDSPFVGDVASGQHVLALCCSMFRAPCHPHQAQDTDFVLVHSLDFNEGFLRPLPTVMCAGQQQPLWEVPTPNTKAATDIAKARITAFIHRWFRNPIYRGVLQIDDVRLAFPGSTENSIRCQLKHLGTFIRGHDKGGWWILKQSYNLPPESEIQRDLPPEDVCAYNSMLAAQARLQQIGIERRFNPLQVRMAFSRARPSKLKGFAALERVLLPQPWYVTSSFREAVETEAPLNLTGPADPSGCGEMWDLTKVPPRIVAGSAANETFDKGKRGKRKRRYRSRLGVTVSGSDLRRLTAEESAKVLEAFGVEAKDLPSNRWTRIEYVRQHSARIASLSPEEQQELDPELVKFAKAATAAATGQRETAFDNPDYARELREGWARQREWLATEDPDWSSGEEDEDEDEADQSEQVDAMGVQMERELESMLEDAEADAEFASLAGTAGASQIAAGKPLPFIKKVKLIKERKDGKRIQREVLEIIRDKDAVKREIEKRRLVKARTGGPKSIDEVTKEADAERIRRRIRENIRRINIDMEDQERQERRLAAGESYKDLYADSKLVCGACGLPGHMRTNKNCPVFQRDHENETKKHVLLEGPTAPLAASVPRAFDYKSSMEYSVATAADRAEVEGWNDPFAQLEKVMQRPSAQELITNPPKATRRKRRRRHEAPDEHRDRVGGGGGAGGSRRRRNFMTGSDDDEPEIADDDDDDDGALSEEEEDDEAALPLDSDDDGGDEGAGAEDGDGDEHFVSRGTRRRPKAAKREREEKEPAATISKPRGGPGRGIRSEGAKGRVQAFNAPIKRAIEEFRKADRFWIFQEPVAWDQPGYWDVVTQPIDLKSIKTRAQRYAYWSAQELWDDLALMRANCVAYNGEDSDITVECDELIAALRERLMELWKQHTIEEWEAQMRADGDIEKLFGDKVPSRTAIRPIPQAPKNAPPPRARAFGNGDEDEEEEFVPEAKLSAAQRRAASGGRGNNRSAGTRRSSASEGGAGSSRRRGRDWDEDDEDDFDDEDDMGDDEDDQWMDEEDSDDTRRKPSKSSKKKHVTVSRPSLAPPVVSTPVQRGGSLSLKLKIAAPMSAPPSMIASTSMAPPAQMPPSTPMGPPSVPSASVTPSTNTAPSVTKIKFRIKVPTPDAAVKEEQKPTE